MTLTDEERAIVDHWRPSETNRICRCVADGICEYHALIAIIDRLTKKRPDESRGAEETGK